MGLTAKDIMVDEVVCVQEGMELDDLMKLFRERRLRGVPVLDSLGHLVGVVSTSDIIFRSTAFGEGATPDTDFHHHHHEEEGVEELLEELEVEGIDYLKVRDIMSKSVISAEVGASVAEVAELMRTHRIHRVVIVEDGKLCGLVGTMDILGAVAEGKLS